MLGYNEFRPREFEAGPTHAGLSPGASTSRWWPTSGPSAPKADLVLTFMHWGDEYVPQPNDRQKALARTMIDAGADVVIGGHPHVAEGAEYYKGKLIVYCLGNFVFDDFKDVEARASRSRRRTGWILRLTMGKSGLVAWDTVITRTGDDGFPSVIPADAESRAARPGPTPSSMTDEPRLGHRRGGPSSWITRSSSAWKSTSSS